MDSTKHVTVAPTCDGCPLKRGCPAFGAGRRACLYGAWPMTITMGGMSALAGIAYAAQSALGL